MIAGARAADAACAAGSRARLSSAAVTVAIVRAEPDLALAGDSGAALAAELAAAVLRGRGRDRHVARGRRVPGAARRRGARLAGRRVEHAGRRCRVHGRGSSSMPRGRRCWRRRHYAGWTSGRSTGRPPSCSRCRSAQASGVLGLASAAVFDPDAQGCVQCPANLLLIADAPGLGHSLGQAGLALTAAWTAALRDARDGAARRAPRRPGDAGRRPVLVPAVAAIVLFGADAVHGLDRGFVSNDPTDRALRLAEAGALALVAAGVALARLRARRTRAALARLVLDIGAAPAPGELRAWLADSLGDPSLELLHRLESGEWIDAEGRRTDPAPAGASAKRLECAPAARKCSPSSTGPVCSMTPLSCPSS